MALLGDIVTGLGKVQQAGRKFTSDYLQGLQIKRQMEAQKFEMDMTAAQAALKLLSDKNVPETVKIKTYNSLVPIWNKYLPDAQMEPISAWPKHGDEYAKKALNIFTSEEYDNDTKRRLLAALGVEAKAKGESVDVGPMMSYLKERVKEEKGATTPIYNRILGQTIEVPKSELPQYLARPELYATKEMLQKEQESKLTEERQKRLAEYREKLKAPKKPPKEFWTELEEAIGRVEQGDDPRKVMFAIAKKYPKQANLAKAFIDVTKVPPEVQQAIASAVRDVRDGAKKAVDAYQEIAIQYPKYSALAKRIIMPISAIIASPTEEAFMKSLGLE